MVAQVPGCGRPVSEETVGDVMRTLPYHEQRSMQEAVQALLLLKQTCSEKQWTAIRYCVNTILAGDE